MIFVFYSNLTTAMEKFYNKTRKVYAETSQN